MLKLEHVKKQYKDFHLDLFPDCEARNDYRADWGERSGKEYNV